MVRNLRPPLLSGLLTKTSWNCGPIVAIMQLFAVIIITGILFVPEKWLTYVRDRQS